MGTMVERPEEAMAGPAHHLMRWHRLCVFWMPPWTTSATSLRNTNGNDGATASGGNDSASASNDALASPLRPLGAAVDVCRRLSAQRRWERW
jgi:hypothetical protein